MTFRSNLFPLALAVALAGGMYASAQPQESAQAEPARRPAAYSIKIVQVADELPEQYLWVGDFAPGKAFRSLASPELQKSLSLLPRGTILRWDLPPDVLLGDAPPSAGEYEAFHELCKAHGITLTTRSAGRLKATEPLRNLAPKRVPLPPIKLRDE